MAKFEFVDTTKDNRTTRRIALSHVMKGKNAGRTHNRRSRLSSAQQPNDRQLSCHFQGVQYGAHVGCASSCGALGAPKWDRLLHASFPVEATPHSQSLITECKWLTMRDEVRLFTNLYSASPHIRRARLVSSSALCISGRHEGILGAGTFRGQDL
jgi:hypothetical protein